LPSTALSQLFDEIPAGLAWLADDGQVRAANAAARQLLDGPTSEAVRRTLLQLALKAGEAPGVLEQTLSLGAPNEIRIVVSRGEDGLLASLSRSGASRLRAEAGVLRTMIGTLVDAGPPEIAIQQVLDNLSSMLAGSAVSVFEARAGQAPHVVARVGPPLEPRLPTSLDPSASSVARALLMRQPVHVSSLARSPFASDRTVAGAERLVSIAVPIQVEGSVAGAIDVCGPTGVLGEGELRLILGLADLVGTLLQRARREATIAAEREARQQALRGLDDAILELEDDGRIVFAAGRAEQIFGAPCAQLVGRRIEMWLGPRNQQRLKTVLAEAAERGQASGEIHISAATGPVPCVISVGVSHTGTSRVVRAVLRDVSARLAVESDLLRAQSVAERQERLARMGRLAAGVAHEINNPLAFIKMNLATLRQALDPAGRNDGADSWSPEELRTIAAEAEEGIARIAKIVRALAGVARDHSDDESLFDPHAVIRDVVKAFEADEVRCHVECGDLPKVRGSSASFGHILQQLLNNGRAAMGPTGALRVRGTAESGWIRVSVTDEGPGIPEDVQRFVFDPFFTTKEFGKGSGLGLYVCRHLAVQLNGTLTFATGPAGTTFTLAIPVDVATQPGPVSGPGAAVSFPGGEERVDFPTGADAAP
jgi:PAS domain S-box-containing protein